MDISLLSILVPFLVAIIAVEVINPSVRKIAVTRNIVDNPDARKLQRTPVPLMGGVSVFFGFYNIAEMDMVVEIKLRPSY